MSSSIQFSIDQNHIGLLTLNRPAARNALNWEMMEAFADTIESILRDGQLRALILTGAGEAFCAGGDLFELHNTTSHADGKRLARLMGDSLERLSDLPFPVIAAIEGPAIGGGAEIALACDMRVAAEASTIGLTQIHLALTPAWGGAGRLIAYLGYPTAYALLTSGEVLEAKRALALGLIQQFVPEGQARHAAFQLALDLIKLDQAALQALKKIMHSHLQMDHAATREIERALFADLWAADAHIEKSTQFVKHKGPS